MTIKDEEFISIILKLPLADDEAKKIAAYLRENGLMIADFDKFYLNKNEKIELVSRISDFEIRLSNKLDWHFKCLIALMSALFAIALAITKLST